MRCDSIISMTVGPPVEYEVVVLRLIEFESVIPAESTVRQYWFKLLYHKTLTSEHENTS